MKKKLLLLLILPFLAPAQSKCITLTDEQIDMIKLGGKIAGGALAVGTVGYVVYKWLTKQPAEVNRVYVIASEDPGNGLGSAQKMQLRSFLDSLPNLNYIGRDGYLNVESWNKNFEKLQVALASVNFAYYYGENSGLADKNVATWIKDIESFVTKLTKVNDDRENYYEVVSNLSYATGLIKNLRALLVD